MPTLFHAVDATTGQNVFINPISVLSITEDRPSGGCRIRFDQGETLVVSQSIRQLIPAIERALNGNSIG